MRRSFVAALACAWALTTGSPAAAQDVTGTSLNIVTPDGSWLRFNGSVFDVYIAGLSRLILSGNEIKFGSLTLDPGKLRLFSLPGVPMCLSWNAAQNPIGAPLDQIELALHCGSTAEDDPNSLGGQIKEFVKRKWSNTDEAMRVTRVTSTAYTSDGLPVVRWSPTYVPDLGPFTPAPPAVIAPPGATGPVIVSQFNLVGDASALTVSGDAQWMTASVAGQDTRLTADVAAPSTSTSLRVEVRRTNTSGTPPYVYLAIDGVFVFSARQLMEVGPVVLTAPWSGGMTHRVEVLNSAQAGTVEIGAVVAQ